MGAPSEDDIVVTKEQPSAHVPMGTSIEIEVNTSGEAADPGPSEEPGPSEAVEPTTAHISVEVNGVKYPVNEEKAQKHLSRFIGEMESRSNAIYSRIIQLQGATPSSDDEANGIASQIEELVAAFAASDLLRDALDAGMSQGPPCPVPLGHAIEELLGLLKTQFNTDVAEGDPVLELDSLQLEKKASITAAVEVLRLEDQYRSEFEEYQAEKDAGCCGGCGCDHSDNKPADEEEQSTEAAGEEAQQEAPAPEVQAEAETSAEATTTAAE